MQAAASVMLTVFGTDDGVRIVARRPVVGRPVRDATQQDDRDAEHDGQQDADVLTRRSVGLEEFVQFRILEPQAAVRDSVLVMRIHSVSHVSHSRGVSMRIHETILSR